MCLLCVCVGGSEVANWVGKWKSRQAKEIFPLVNQLSGQPRPSLDDEQSASVSPTQHLAFWLILLCTCIERQLVSLVNDEL